MLTHKETDTPVAAYLEIRTSSGWHYRGVGGRIYYDDKPQYNCPQKLRRILALQGILPAREGDEITCDFPHEKFGPVFSRKERITMFIAGCQNCGKSYYISQFVKRHREFCYGRPIYLVTGLSEKDAHFEGLDMWKVDLMTIPSLTLEHFRRLGPDSERTGSLVIIDDVDRITDDKVNKAVQKLISDILSNGRDHATQQGIADIDIIITNHEVNDYRRTKPMLTECNYVVLCCSPVPLWEGR